MTSSVEFFKYILLLCTVPQVLSRRWVHQENVESLFVSCANAENKERVNFVVVSYAIRCAVWIHAICACSCCPNACKGSFVQTQGEPDVCKCTVDHFEGQTFKFAFCLYILYVYWALLEWELHFCKGVLSLEDVQIALFCIPLPPPSSLLRFVRQFIVTLFSFGFQTQTGHPTA